jgi:hypothetical protein
MWALGLRTDVNHLSVTPRGLRGHHSFIRIFSRWHRQAARQILTIHVAATSRCYAARTNCFRCDFSNSGAHMPAKIRGHLVVEKALPRLQRMTAVNGRKHFTNVKCDSCKYDNRESCQAHNILLHAISEASDAVSRVGRDRDCNA